MSLSLPDFTKSTVIAFLELVYTGRTFFNVSPESFGFPTTDSFIYIYIQFQSNTDYEKVVDLGKHLGFAVPAAGLSFVQGEYDEERAQAQQKISNKRKSMDTSTPMRKKSKTEIPEKINEIQVEGFQASPMPFKCSICSLNFSSKYLLKKHAKDCFEVEKPMETEQVEETQNKSSEELSGKGKCENCGQIFSLNGGWLTKHQRTCLPAPQETEKHESSSSSNEAESSPQKSPGKKKECPNCGESFPVQGGWITKHLSKCTAQTKEQETAVKLEIYPADKIDVTEKAENTIEGSNSCPKCGKTYAPHVSRFLKDHILKCNAENTTNHSVQEEQIEVPRPDEIPEIPEKPKDLKDYEALYQKGEWNCYACGKWFLRRDVLRQHLLTHYKNEVRAKYMTGERNDICTICGFEARDPKALLQHVSLSVHQKIKDFMPEVMANIMFNKSKDVTEESISMDTDQSNNTINEKVDQSLEHPEEKSFKCGVCNENCEDKNSLTDHLVEHFSSQIMDRFVESGTKCKICRYHDANLAQLTKHVALQHEKIREYLPAQVGDDLFALINDSHNDDTNDTSIDLNETSVNNEASELSDKTVDKSSDKKVDDKAESTSKLFDCYICSKPNKSRGDLRQHIVCHIRHEIQAKYYPNVDQIKMCIECDYKSNIGEHILMHLALKHQKIIEFVPKDVAEKIYFKKSVNKSNQNKSKVSPSPKSKIVNCVRCKAFVPKEDLKNHFEICHWKCDHCAIQLRDPKSIKVHRSACGATNENSPNAENDTKTNETKNSPIKTNPNENSDDNPNPGLICQLCFKECKHFHYFKGHMSMHYREDIRNRVSEWGGGLGGSGFACQLCDFTTLTKDSLVTHAGYKHALFTDFMTQPQREAFYEVVKQIDEKTEGWVNKPVKKTVKKPVPEKPVTEKPVPEKPVPERRVMEKRVPDNPDFSCPKCKIDFGSQYLLASHMTNTNCLPVFNSVVRCLLCDFEVGSVLQYKCHLMVHFRVNVEDEVRDTFKEVSGICKECDPNGKPMEFQDFASHLALDHDRIINVVSHEIRNHLSQAFPGSDAIIRYVNRSRKRHVKIPFFCPTLLKIRRKLQNSLESFMPMTRILQKIRDIPGYVQIFRFYIFSGFSCNFSEFLDHCFFR